MKSIIALFSNIIALALIVFGLSCKSSKSVNDLYKFPSTKDVLVLVNIDYTVDAGDGSAIDLAGRAFLLNAYALDGGQQVSMSVAGQDFVENLPVTLTGAHTSFEATMRIPVEVQPRENGYAFRFELNEQLSALRFFADTSDKLDALRGEVKAGTSASTNNVDLSLSSTVAYSLLSGSVSNVGSDLALSSYAELSSLIKERQATVETGIDTSGIHDLASYMSAVISGLQYQILTDTAFQKSLAEKILSTIESALPDTEKATTQEALAKAFTATLINLATSVRNELNDPSTIVAKVFKSGFIDIQTLPEPETYANAVFAPLSLSFTDTDNTATLGGDVTITAPLVQTGVASYNVYFGGESKTTAKILSIGSVAASASPLAITLAGGTAQPSGATRFWAYPVASGVELDVPASTGIFNLGGTNLAPQPPSPVTAVSSGVQNTISWGSVSGVDSYNLYWSTTSPVRKSSNRIKNVTSAYFHKNLLPNTEYYYAVSSVKGGIESHLSVEATVSTSSIPTAAAPVAFTMVSAVAGNGSNTVTWNTSTGASYYVLKRGDESGKYTTTLSISATSPFVDPTPKAAKTHYYKVVAVGEGGSTAATDEVSARTSWPVRILTGTQSVNHEEVAIDSKGDIYLIGSTSGNLEGTVPIGYVDGYLVKYSSDGTFQWIKRWGSAGTGSCIGYAQTEPGAMKIDANDNIYIAGLSCGPLSTDLNEIGNGKTDMYLIKFSRSGEHLWTKLHGTATGDSFSQGVTFTQAFGLAVDSSGNAFVVGRTNGDLGGTTKIGELDAFVVKYNSAGVRHWTVHLGVAGLTTTEANAAAVDKDGNVYVAGFTQEAQDDTGNAGSLPGNTGVGGRDGFVAKYSSSGTRAWIKQFGAAKIAGAGSVTPNDVIVDSMGNVIIAGETTVNYGGQGLNGSKDRFVQKFNSSGVSQWIVQSGLSTRLAIARSVAVDSSDNIYTVGLTNGAIEGITMSGGMDLVMTKYQSDGTRNWTTNLGKASTTTQGRGIALSAENEICVVGRTSGDLSGIRAGAPDSGFLAKYSFDGER